jgi:hypothetical protein
MGTKERQLPQAGEVADGAPLVLAHRAADPLEDAALTQPVRSARRPRDEAPAPLADRFLLDLVRRASGR